MVRSGVFAFANNRGAKTASAVRPAAQEIKFQRRQLPRRRLSFKRVNMKEEKGRRFKAKVIRHIWQTSETRNSANGCCFPNMYVIFMEICLFPA